MEFDKNLSIFLCGDMMTGRGIDQILPHPSRPELHEFFVKDARDYIILAEQVNGKISYPVSMEHIWGDALTVWQQQKPHVKIINLETTITQSEGYWPDKGIHYRMHPLNVDIFKVAGVDICTLANNHILDWGYSGLKETIASLKKSNIKCCGAGNNITQAIKPAIFELKSNKNILVFAVGAASSGIPPTWEATPKTPGVYYLSDLSLDRVRSIAQHINQFKQDGDLIILSIHWGSNWGYEISETFRVFAHALIDHAHVDVIFGHSSHHPRPIEIYKNKPIFYGCGDFINDYEGISGHGVYRGDLTVMYFLDFDCPSLQCKKLTLVPMRIKNFRLHCASKEDCEWMLDTFNSFSGFGEKFILFNHQLVTLLT